MERFPVIGEDDQMHAVEGTLSDEVRQGYEGSAELSDLEAAAEANGGALPLPPSTEQ